MLLKRLVHYTERNSYYNNNVLEHLKADNNNGISPCVHNEYASRIHGHKIYNAISVRPLRDLTVLFFQLNTRFTNEGLYMICF